MKRFIYLISLYCLSLTGAFSQTTFVVSSNADDGATSLRAAIASVNSSTLTGPFTITCTTAGPISLTAELPSIAKSCTIIGVNSTRTIIERSSTAPTQFRIFQLADNSNVVMRWLTIRKGSVGDSGGGIFNNGPLLIDQCLITANQSTAGSGGGGIFTNSLGSLTVINSTVSSNSASFAGGGIAQTYGGSMHIINSTIATNYAPQGAILNQGFGAIATAYISNCAVLNNISDGNTGGILSTAYNNPTSLTVVNTTISGNIGTYNAGGLLCFINGSVASAFVEHCTIVNNQNKSAGAGGVEIYNTTTTLRNNIIANNSNANSQYSSINNSAGYIISLGYNLVSDNPASLTAMGDKRNTNPQLLPLADNGGPTLTHALICNSPAVNAGTASGTTSDQRGFAYVGTSDIGAYEYYPVLFSAGAITASGPASCASPARLTAPVTGSSFVFTGPGGYVFSNVYRNGGNYTAFAEGVKLGGTYTLTVYGSADCPLGSTSTVLVQGPGSCP